MRGYELLDYLGRLNFIADLHLLTQALNRDIERVRSKGKKVFVTSVSDIVALSK